MGKEQERMCIPVTKDGKPAYRIYLEESFEKLPDCLASLEPRGRKVCIVTDSSVHELYGEEMENLISLSAAR